MKSVGRTDVPIVRVRVDSLLPADSPRLDGESPTHVAVLAESDASLPPILVHRTTMRVIDGMHRLRAAERRGCREIAVRFFDGDSEDAFVAAVEANSAHGLPLSVADRAAAAERILGAHPDWSDRAVASITGLANKTVATIRRRAEDIPAATERIGLDGRARPLDTTRGRLLAYDLIRANPGASLRQIGRAASISTGTVRDVRDRLLRGEDPLPTRRRTRTGTHLDEEPTTQLRDRAKVTALLACLRKDPSLRLTETGRALLRLLDLCVLDDARLDRLADTLPPHCAVPLAEVADECARIWAGFADRVHERAVAHT